MASSASTIATESELHEAPTSPGTSPTSGWTPPAASQPSEHKFRKYRRFTDAENELIVETHRQHEAKRWGVQVDIYNAEARKRGLCDDMNTAAFVAKCKRFKSDEEVAAVRAGEYGPGTRRRWDREEDAVLGTWDARIKFSTAYKGFIKYMRATYDRNYYRSTNAVLMRLKFLQDRAVAAGTSSAKRESETDARVKNSSPQTSGLNGSNTPTTPSEDGAGARAWPVWVTPSPVRETHTIDQETQTDDAEESGASSDVVPTGTSATSVARVERILRYMQTLLRTSTEAMLGKSPPAESCKAAQTLHTDVLAMISGALTALKGEEEVGNGSLQPKMELEDFIQFQYKTLMNIMDEKVVAAKERAQRLQQDYEEERQKLEEEMSALQAKCRVAETESTELQEEVARCKRELESQSTRIDELMRVKQNVQEQQIESEPLHKSTEQEHERPEPKQSKRTNEGSPDNRAQKKSNNADGQSSSPMPLPKFSRLSDDLLERTRPRPNAEQVELASVLAGVHDATAELS